MSTPLMRIRMRREQVEREMAERSEQTYRLCLDSAETAEQKREYRQSLARTLIAQGKLDEALECVKGKSGCKRTADLVRLIINSEWKAASDLCRCPDPIIDVEKDDRGTIQGFVSSRWVSRLRYYSQKYKAFTVLYECSCCGHTNALPDHPDDKSRLVQLARASFPDEGKGHDSKVLIPNS